MNIPERLTWTVERLGLTGGERVLEIGCGRGMAASLVLSKLTAGRLVAVDRSSTAIDAARKLNIAHEVAGKLAVVQIDIEHFDVGSARFDIVFAINVNLFWIEADAALTIIRALLAPGGRLVLSYEPPSAAQVEPIATKLKTNLEAAGWRVLAVDRVAHAPLLMVEARSG